MVDKNLTFKNFIVQKLLSQRTKVRSFVGQKLSFENIKSSVYLHFTFSL